MQCSQTRQIVYWQTYLPPHKHRNISRINSEARSDIRWWHMFIESWNGISILQQQALSHLDHELWSNASGALGAGAFWNSDWIQFQWPQAIQHEQIAIKELAPIAIACALWGRQWKATTVRANCDNEAEVMVIN